MAGKSPQPSYEPPFQAEGTLGATHARLERGREAQSWGKSWPRTNKVLRHATKTTGKGERCASNTCQASWRAIPVIVVMGVYNKLYRSDTLLSLDHLLSVLVSHKRLLKYSSCANAEAMTSVATREPSSEEDGLNTRYRPLAIYRGAIRKKEKWARS